MTWRRVIHRNALSDGDYLKAPLGWSLQVNVTDPGLGSMEELRGHVWPYLVIRAEGYERQAKNLAGDLRRLELDALDEGEICLAIERTTMVPSEVVAVVLQEFLKL